MHVLDFGPFRSGVVDENNYIGVTVYVFIAWKAAKPLKVKMSFFFVMCVCVLQ